MVRRAVVPLTLAAIAAVVTSLVPTGGAGADTSGALVVVRDSSYTPSRVGIRPGDVVIWTRPDGPNGSMLTHSVTSDDGRFDADLTDQNRSAGYRFPEPGTYAYHCKYHGSPGGRGMAGVIVVEGAVTTTTTAPAPTTTTTPTTGPTSTTTTGPTTTTTAPPTTTTTKPPKPPKTTTTTTTAPPPPPTTATTAPPPPAWEPPPQAPPPPPPGPPSSGAMNPPPVGRPAPTSPPQKRNPAPSNAKDRSATADPGNTKEPAPPTTDTTVPAAPDPAAIAAAEAAAAAAAAGAVAPPPEAAAPAPSGPPPVEPLDPAILDTLAAASDKPPDNGSELLLVAGIGLVLFVLCVTAWAWYHRSSRYMPA